MNSPMQPPYPGPGVPYNGMPVTVVPPKPKKKRRAGVVIVVILAILVALVGFYTTLTILSHNLLPKIAVVDIDGTIGSDAGANTPLGLLSYLNEARSDDNIVAVVLRVDSGGGAAAAGEEMAQYVKEFSKPIVVSSASTNASAAYMISSQADYIFANKASAVGSIGTVLQVTDYSGLLKMLGIRITNIASAESKDASYGTRHLTKEEIAFYQDLVNQINDNFIRVVAEGRDIDASKVKEYATGMAFTGIDAVNMGLVDEIGTYESAVAKAAELAGVTSYTITPLRTQNSGISGLLDVLLGSSNNNINITVGSSSTSDGSDLVRDGYALK